MNCVVCESKKLPVPQAASLADELQSMSDTAERELASCLQRSGDPAKMEQVARKLESIACCLRKSAARSTRRKPCTQGWNAGAWLMGCETSGRHVAQLEHSLTMSRFPPSTCICSPHPRFIQTLYLSW